uniref:Uncharacterized protein n=1 Tax=Eutreptiella gymnastica TaxID=73025 RepID=A0A7S1IWC9_9EUGL|mmetsp:Transcript_46800/g.83938  ORF Transcript_46800/g.83938 Transcript_46800/m.83938 type:complete len:127 (+) Transcript_46800:198-578(+)
MSPPDPPSWPWPELKTPTDSHHPLSTQVTSVVIKCLPKIGDSFPEGGRARLGISSLTPGAGATLLAPSTLVFFTQQGPPIKSLQHWPPPWVAGRLTLTGDAAFLILCSSGRVSPGKGAPPPASSLY